MSQAGLEAVRLAVDEVKSVLITLTDEEWQLPSGCTGWRVVDLAAHMSSNYREIVEPSPPPAEPISLPAERMMDLMVDARQAWTPSQVRDEYLTYCDKAVEALAAMQDEPLASTVIPMADLGEYPMHSLADAFAFDHYCHLRVDLLAPDGPIDREIPDADEARLAPAIGWMLTGLPQMQPNLHEFLSAPLRLRLTGQGGGSWMINHNDDGDGIVVTPGVGGEPAAATISSNSHGFVIWGTARESWRDHCKVIGDQETAARFLDALNII